MMRRTHIRRRCRNFVIMTGTTQKQQGHSTDGNAAVTETDNALRHATMRRLSEFVVSWEALATKLQQNDPSIATWIGLHPLSPPSAIRHIGSSVEQRGC